jgi:hypothetical protein
LTFVETISLVGQAARQIEDEAEKGKTKKKD